MAPKIVSNATLIKNVLYNEPFEVPMSDFMLCAGAPVVGCIPAQKSFPLGSSSPGSLT